MGDFYETATGSIIALSLILIGLVIYVYIKGDDDDYHRLG